MVDEIHASDFDREVLNNEQTVVVDFFADWCNPCKQYSPTFESVAQQKTDAKFVKVDVGEDPTLAMQYGIRSVPTTGVFRNGELVDSRSGVLAEDTLAMMVST